MSKENNSGLCARKKGQQHKQEKEISSNLTKVPSHNVPLLLVILNYLFFDAKGIKNVF